MCDGQSDEVEAELLCLERDLIEAYRDNSRLRRRIAEAERHLELLKASVIPRIYPGC